MSETGQQLIGETSVSKALYGSSDRKKRVKSRKDPNEHVLGNVFGRDNNSSSSDNI